MTERFNKAYNSLVNAFYNGTLAKGTCKACAVGNIVADAIGIKARVPKNTEEHITIDDNEYWDAIVFSSSAHNNKIEGLKCVIATGYSGQELLLIERAFENNTDINWDEYNKSSEQDILEDQFNGLCAVVDVLLELDNIKPEEHYKQKFREHPKLVTI